ncbi:MAG: Ldh family oxidoreductase [Caldilineaceae bacterium]|nr:Ldh family oxidoreductase [Caldilineaceae bacterium]
MKYLTADQLQDICTRILDAAGSPHAESETVCEVLVRANLFGHDSHGVMRIPQYVGQIRSGAIRPGTPIEIERETPASAVIQAHQGWGMVIARQAMRLAIEKARQVAVGTVVVRGSQHVGRVGEYPTMAAEEGMIGMAVVNSYGTTGSVAPFGGAERRLSPNPIAFAMPSGGPWPVMVDITTSVFPEGKIRVTRYAGKQLPEGVIVDADGNPTTDPAAFYGSPPGALLPLGGIVGHKGFALGIVAELLAGALSGAGVTGKERDVTGNGVYFQAINIDALLPYDDFIHTVQEQIAWVKSARPQPGVSEVLFPGEPEYRTAQQRSAHGIPVEDSIWHEITETADTLGVKIEA